MTSGAGETGQALGETVGTAAAVIGSPTKHRVAGSFAPATNGSPPVFRFGGLTLDLAQSLLLRGAEDVPLRRKSFDLLAYLARNAGRVVSNDELLRAVWSDVTVTEDSLTRCVLEVRRALGPEGQTLLRTFPPARLSACD